MKILFVCLGNICRSPAAEGAFLHLVKEKGLEDQFEIDSAGTSAYHEGEPADARMREAGERRGFALKSRARVFKEDDFKKFDKIFVMDKSNLKNVLKLAKSSEDESKVRLFGELAHKHEETEVPDPYFGGEKGFEKVLDMVENASSNFIKECGF